MAGHTRFLPLNQQGQPLNYTSAVHFVAMRRRKKFKTKQYGCLNLVHVFMNLLNAQSMRVILALSFLPKMN